MTNCIMKRQFVYGSSAAALLPIPTLGPPCSAWKCKFCLKVFVEKTEFDIHLKDDHNYYEIQDEIMITSVCSLDKDQEFLKSQRVSSSTSTSMHLGEENENQQPAKRRKANNTTETGTKDSITFKIKAEAGINNTVENEVSDSVTPRGVPEMIIKEETEGSPSKLKIDEYHSVGHKSPVSFSVPAPVPATVISSSSGEFASDLNNLKIDIAIGETYEETSTDPFANIKCQILEYNVVNTTMVESDHSSAASAVSETITNYIDDDSDILQHQQLQNIQIAPEILDPCCNLTQSSSGSNNPRDLADEFKDFKTLCIQNFAEIHSKQASIESMCKEILRKLDSRGAGRGPGHRILSATEFRFGFPFKTEESLLEFNSKISNDLSLRGNAVRCLSLIGGSDVVEMCNSIIRKMLSDEVLTKFSYCGTAEKKSFSDLEINKLVFDAVYANRSTSTAPEKEIRKAIMNFVCHASDRLKYHLKKGSNNNGGKKGPVPSSSNRNRINKQLTNVGSNNNTNNTEKADVPKPSPKRTY